MHRLVFRTAFGIALLSVTLSAQTPGPPDYSGTWRLMGPGSSETGPLIVRQTATNVLVEMPQEGDRGTYELGRVLLFPDPHADVQLTIGASWDGAKLRLTNAYWPKGALGSVTERVLSLSPSGRLMIEMIRRSARGAPTSMQTEWVRQ